MAVCDDKSIFDDDYDYNNDYDDDNLFCSYVRSSDRTTVESDE